ncbi:MAG: plasmid pRiA4b ORF-3 family protein [Candidatus Hodarchaeota archaeon]
MDPLTNIKISEFYSDDSEKTFKNWFCYEAALNIENEMEYLVEEFGDEVSIKFLDVPAFSTALAKRILHRLLNSVSFKGQQMSLKHFFLPPKMITAIVPNAPIAIAEEISKSLGRCLNYQLEECMDCPNHCLKHPVKQCAFFDMPEYTDNQSRTGDEGDDGQYFKDLMDDLMRLSPSHGAEKTWGFTVPEDSGDFEEKIFQFKISLKHIKPPIWRRIQISNKATFQELHQAIMDFFGWDGYHLHEFVMHDSNLSKLKLTVKQSNVDGESWGDIQEDEILLGNLISMDHKRVHYTYDFGDNWEHLILLENVLDIEAGKKYPACTKSKGVCPEEDSGGPWSYMDGEDEDDEW